MSHIGGQIEERPIESTIEEHPDSAGVLTDQLHAGIGGILSERDGLAQTAGHQLESELRSCRFSEQTEKTDEKGQDYTHLNPEVRADQVPRWGRGLVITPVSASRP